MQLYSQQVFYADIFQLRDDLISFLARQIFVFEFSKLVISTEAADPDQGECSNTGDTNSQGQDSRANKIIVDCCHGVITSQSLFYCQAQLQLQLQLKLSLALIPFDPATHPPGNRRKSLTTS